MTLKYDIEDKISKIKNNKCQGKLIWIDDKWENNDFKGWLQKLNCKKNPGDIIYDERNLLYYAQANEKNGLKNDIIIKNFKLKRKYDKIRFCLINSKAIRSLKIALALIEIDIKTPFPVAILEKRGKLNKIEYSYYISKYVDYDYNLLDIAKDYDHPQRNKLVENLPQIAHDIRKMHEVGIIHNDFHAGNILIKEEVNSSDIYYIDLNRGRLKENLSINAKIKDLARLKLNNNEKKIFLKEYAPDNYCKLLDLMIKYRQKRLKYIYWKKKIKNIFK